MWRTIADVMHKMLEKMDEELHPEGAKDRRKIQTERNADRVGYNTIMLKMVRKCESLNIVSKAQSSSCAATMPAYMPPSNTSSSCRPCSTILPASKTKILSAC